MHHFLTDEERSSLSRQHKLERDKRVCDRIKAVLLYDDGWELNEIAYVLLITDETVRHHVEEYKATRKLKPENGGSCSKLNPLQTKALLEHLQECTYLYAKDIVRYVFESFGIEYSIPGMTTWLYRNRFSYKKPAVVPGKANAIAQEEWIRRYEALKKRLPADEAICFIDGVHPTHNTTSAFGWIRKGLRKEIKSNTGRQRLNLSGAIDIVSKEVFVLEDEVLNASSTITFLRKLESRYPASNRVHVFCDNARYYKNKEVSTYLAASKIEMHFLPPYSPNLNPIERLWKCMHEKVLYNRYYERFSEFKDAVMGFFQGLLDPPRELRKVLENRITDRFQRVSLASAHSFKIGPAR